MIEPLWRTVALALADLIARFGPPGDVCRLNCAPGHTLGRRIAEVRRLQKIVRYVLVVYAQELVALLAPWRAKVRAEVTRRVGARSRVVPGDPATWRVGFVLPKRLNPFKRWGSNAGQPMALACAVRNPCVTLARQMEGLRRMMQAPLRHVRRIARCMQRDAIRVVSRRPKRKPPPDRRAYFDDLQDARDAASWATHPGNPWTRTTPWNTS